MLAQASSFRTEPSSSASQSTSTTSPWASSSTQARRSAASPPPADRSYSTSQRRVRTRTKSPRCGVGIVLSPSSAPIVALKQAHVANRSAYVQKKTQKSRQCDTTTGRQNQLQRWGTSTLCGLNDGDNDPSHEIRGNGVRPHPMGQPLDRE